MTKKELRNRKYPYLDPLPKYSLLDLVGEVLILLGVLGIIYILLFVG